MSKYIKDTKFEPHSEYDMDPDKWPHYRKQLSREDRAKRLSNHRNQHLRTKQCVEMIRDSENTADGTYNTIIKMRDNSLILQACLCSMLHTPHAAFQFTFYPCAAIDPWA